MISVDAYAPVTVEAFAQRGYLTRFQVDTQTLSFRILPIISIEVRNIPLIIALNASQLLPLVFLTEGAFRNPAVNRHEYGLIILIPELVHHNQHLPELRKNVEIVSIHQMRIHQCLPS